MLTIIKLIIVKGAVDDTVYLQTDGSYGGRAAAFKCGTMIEATYKLNQLKSNDNLIITLY